MNQPYNFLRPIASNKKRSILWFAFAVMLGHINIEWNESQFVAIGFTQNADAIVRRAVAARTVAAPVRGVARRTARRVSRRWAVGTQLYSLPPDCYWANNAWYCEDDGVYFQQTYVNNTIIYIAI